jgi:hypothetical protein
MATLATAFPTKPGPDGPITIEPLSRGTSQRRPVLATAVGALLDSADNEENQ